MCHSYVLIRAITVIQYTYFNTDINNIVFTDPDYVLTKYAHCLVIANILEKSFDSLHIDIKKELIKQQN